MGSEKQNETFPKSLEERMNTFDAVHARKAWERASAEAEFEWDELCENLRHVTECLELANRAGHCWPDDVVIAQKLRSCAHHIINKYSSVRDALMRVQG